MRRILLVLPLAGACLAPPPPIVAETPFGAVRAASSEKAAEIARLLERLAPQVREVLPGAQDRPVDVWVQENLRVYRFQDRPKSVRGFTLLSGEFDAKRIHLQESGQSPWYLAHELVHALIGPSWNTLPGILEEGLGDVVAEMLNQEYQKHIRAHRLLNASAFTDGLDVMFVYRDPGAVARERWKEATVRLRTQESVPAGTLEQLLETPRAELHHKWPEIPESFYGLAWLIVSRIQKAHGLDGLHELCQRAEAEGKGLVPKEWLYEAAGIDPEGFDASFLRRSFASDELHTAIYLQPDAFADVLLEALKPIEASFGLYRMFYDVRPAVVTHDGTELPLHYYSNPLAARINARWGG